MFNTGESIQTKTSKTLPKTPSSLSPPFQKKRIEIEQNYKKKMKKRKQITCHIISIVHPQKPKKKKKIHQRNIIGIPFCPSH